jgi:hypothetical protein
MVPAMPALADVRAPTPIRVDGTVLSPNAVVSPITGYTAAVIGWRFYTQFTDTSGQMNKVRCKLLFACARGEGLVLATPHGTVLVPAAGREIRPTHPGPGVPLEVPLPPEAAELATWSAPGLIYCDELLLRNGDAVRLRATVAPTGAEHGSAYRSSSGERCDFEALPRLGPVVVEDLPVSLG